MIYITEEGKESLKIKISDIEEQISISLSNNDTIRAGIETFEKKVYEEFLNSATILPSISDWIEVCSTTDAIFFREKFPNGVIIKP